MCVLQYKYRTILEMLPKLMKLCAIMGRRYTTSRTAAPTNMTITRNATLDTSIANAVDVLVEAHGAAAHPGVCRLCPSVPSRCMPPLSHPGVCHRCPSIFRLVHSHFLFCAYSSFTSQVFLPYKCCMFENIVQTEKYVLREWRAGCRHGCGRLGLCAHRCTQR